MSHLKIEYKDIGKLAFYEKNSRTHSNSQVRQIVQSIKEFGWTNPILIDENNGVIAGHGRLLACEKMGLYTAPCITLTGLTEAQKKAYVIADNSIALNADWNLDTLTSEVNDLIALDFDNTHEVMTDVWRARYVMNEERHGHATPKPIELMQRVMKSSLPEGGLCVEPFGGSGSTLMGAITTGRRCHTMELEPKYIDAIIERWQNHTSEKAVKE